MTMRRLYMDNAATSFPKPAAVIEAMVRYANELGASAGRGGYAEAIETGRIISDCRELLSRLFNGEDPNHFVFTLNCSDALNLAIKGLIDPDIATEAKPTGGAKAHVICTAIDHNSILRPIHAMLERGWVTQTLIPVDPRTGLVDVDDIRRAIRPGTRLIAATHASNVTGTLQPIRAIGQIAREHDIPFVVDAAQSAGHVPIDVQADYIDLLAAPGHKGLMGPLGTGFLYLRPGIEKLVRPLREGGTGSLSEHPVQPQFMPDKYEPGSHNAIGIAGLCEGLRWVSKRTVQTIHAQNSKVCAAFAEVLGDVEGLRCFAPLDVKERIGVYSFRIDGYTPEELAGTLEQDFGILSRAGLHCAPHIHATLGTAPLGGTTRLSFGPFITTEDARRAATALQQVAQTRLAI